MSAPKGRDTDSIAFLIARPRAFTCTEAARVRPEANDPPAHDAFTRLLHRLEPDPEALWREARPAVAKAGGVLVLDDSTRDTPYAKEMGRGGRPWSGQHKRVVWGLNRITPLGTDGDRHVPGAYRLSDEVHDGLTEDDHFRAMLGTAHARGFHPACVAFDGWDSGLGNLQAIRGRGGRGRTPPQVNRKVNLDRQGSRRGP